MKNHVIIVKQAGLGTTADDPAFGLEMLDKFFHALEGQAGRPKAICFYTEGVRVLAPGSDLELALKLLERLGIELVACGTCLEHYGIGDRIVAGRVGTMADIVALMSEAEQVITI